MVRHVRYGNEAAHGLQQRVGQRIRQARQERGLSLAQLGGGEMSRGFLSAVERGHSGLSFAALAIIAQRLKLPMGYFVDEVPDIPTRTTGVSVDHAEAAVGYSLYLRSQGKIEAALEYALWAAQARIGREQQFVRGKD